MPDDRPMPLTGEREIMPHSVFGEHVDHFPSKRWVPLAQGWSFLIGASLLWNLATWNIDTTAYGPLIAIVFALIALAIGWWVMHLWNREVILYKRGFTYREGSKDIPFLYEELAAIRLEGEQMAYFGGLLRQTRFRITVKTFTGDEFQLNNIYRRVQVLGDELNRIVTDNRRPQLAAALAAGDTFAFTPYFEVSAAGLLVRAEVLTDTDTDALLPWANFGGFKAQQRQLHIHTTDGSVWFMLPLAEVENLVLLLEVLRERRPARTVGEAL